MFNIFIFSFAKGKIQSVYMETKRLKEANKIKFISSLIINLIAQT